MEKEMEVLQKLIENLEDKKGTEVEIEAIQWAMKTVRDERERSKMLSQKYVGVFVSYVEVLNEFMPEWKYFNGKNIEELTKLLEENKNKGD